MAPPYPIEWPMTDRWFVGSGGLWLPGAKAWTAVTRGILWPCLGETRGIGPNRPRAKRVCCDFQKGENQSRPIYYEPILMVHCAGEDHRMVAPPYLSPVPARSVHASPALQLLSSSLPQFLSILAVLAVST